MALKVQRSPPQKVASFPDLTVKDTDNSNATFVDSRKRKHFDEKTDADVISKLFDEKLKVQTDALNSQLTSEFSKITEILANMNTTISSLHTDNASFKVSFKEINDRLSEMDRSLGAFNERQDTFENRLQALESQTSIGRELPEQVQVLENKLAAMEQQARECNVEINNLPERRSENLVSLVIDLGKITNQNIAPTDIVAVHRVPHANLKDDRPRNIIVKFTTKMLRDNLVASCRAKKGITSDQLSITGSSQKIYVNEHLTLKNKQLFRETREKARTREFKHVWVKHGVILARKTDTSPVIAIRSLQDIDKLKS